MSKIANSEGGVQAILAQDETELGRRPTEYASPYARFILAEEKK